MMIPKNNKRSFLRYGFLKKKMTISENKKMAKTLKVELIPNATIRAVTLIQK